MIAQGGSAQDADGGIDCFAGDIVARHSLAKTLGAIFKSGPDNQIIGILAAVGGMANGPLEWNADRESAELDNSHNHFAFDLVAVRPKASSNRPRPGPPIYLPERQ